MSDSLFQQIPFKDSEGRQTKAPVLHNEAWSMIYGIQGQDGSAPAVAPDAAIARTSNSPPLEVDPVRKANTYNEALDTVVSVIVFDREHPAPPLGSQFVPGTEKKFGTGVCVRSDGKFVTNDHVISGETDLMLVDSEGHQRYAAVVARDPASDLAILQVLGLNKDGKVNFIPFGSSNTLAEHQPLAIYGYPNDVHGMQYSPGQFRCLVDKSNQKVIDKRASYSTLQLNGTDLPHGNSGSAVLDSSGRLVGIIQGNKYPATFAGPCVGVVIPVEGVRGLLSRIR